MDNTEKVKNCHVRAGKTYNESSGRCSDLWGNGARKLHFIPVFSFTIGTLDRLLTCSSALSQ